MLRSVNNLHHYEIRARDGSIGRVEEFYFDDQRWVVRYLVVDTGNWLPGRKVLISPISVVDTDWIAARVTVSLSKQQVRESPPIDTEQPVSREHEAKYLQYYGYPYYWAGPGLWGGGMYPFAVPVVEGARAAAVARPPLEPSRSGHHLRRTKEVIGYHLEARDGGLGHVEDFLVDDKTWALRYLVVDTKNWWPGKKTLVAVGWITGIDWATRHVTVDLSRDAVKHAPAYDKGRHVDRQWETDYYAHYRRAGYWSEEVRS